MKSFPKDFFWGAATAAYQVEGGIENCDWAEAAREERVPVCGIACDHYNRYEADFDIAKSLGHTAHRFSVEWARIEPEEGKFDVKSIEHYREVLKALHARGLKPHITLWHFTLPTWFAKEGGFERCEAPALFTRYCVYVAHQLGDLCDNFTTMNEPNVFGSQGWINGEWPPFKISKKPWKRDSENYLVKKRAKLLTLKKYFDVMDNLAKSHIMAYVNIKKINPSLTVGLVKHIHIYLEPNGLINKFKRNVIDYLQNKRFLNKVHSHLDQIGINFYQASRYGSEVTDKKTDMGWNFTPEHIFDAIMLVSKYNLPMHISEAGLADHDDSDRAEYIEKQVAGVWRAIKHGADVRGHFYWSLLDNYEWALGFEKRFGLVEVDYKTQKRTIRSSAYVYKKIIQDNGLLE